MYLKFHSDCSQTGAQTPLIWSPWPPPSGARCSLPQHSDFILLFVPRCQSQENCSPCILRLCRVCFNKAIRLSVISADHPPKRKSFVLLCQNLLTLPGGEGSGIPFLASILLLMGPMCHSKASPICSDLDDESGMGGQGRSSIFHRDVHLITSHSHGMILIPHYGKLFLL